MEAVVCSLEDSSIAHHHRRTGSAGGYSGNDGSLEQRTEARVANVPDRLNSPGLADSKAEARFSSNACNHGRSPCVRTWARFLGWGDLGRSATGNQSHVASHRCRTRPDLVPLRCGLGHRAHPAPSTRRPVESGASPTSRPARIRRVTPGTRRKGWTCWPPRSASASRLARTAETATSRAGAAVDSLHPAPPWRRRAVYERGEESQETT